MPRAVAVWMLLAVAVLVPLAIAATSPLLQWRGPVYIAAGLAGVLALGLLLVQPLLIAGAMPVLTPRRSRAWHRWGGTALLVLVAMHIVGLWITSPPDVIDVLLFRSPTPFSLWGAIAMWAVFGAALLATMRRRLAPRTWRLAHASLAAVTVASTVVHAMLIEGAMGTASKAALCALALAATLLVVGRTLRTHL